MNAERLLMIIRQPHTSEKATIIADKNKQYTFKVLRNANKSEIKQAIEHVFNVQVSRVSVVNVKGKKKRFKQTSGQRSDWKKAYIMLKPGSDIDFNVAE
jgi:large subunit ribosomal protein L23